MEPTHSDGRHRLCSSNDTSPFIRLPRQEAPPKGRALADPLQPSAPLPSSQLPQLPDGQREQANRALQAPADCAADTTVAQANRPTTVFEDQRQYQLPQFQHYLLVPVHVQPAPPQYLGIASQSASSTGDRTPTPQSPLLPPLALSAGDRTPTAESPRTPTVETTSIPPLSLSTRNKIPAEEPPQIPHDDTDLCSPISSTGSDLSVGEYLPEYLG